MLISVLRSRNISVALILQSVSQLRTIYSEAQSATVFSNADHILYLGGSDGDQQTIHYLADRAGISPEDVMGLDNSCALLITRGEREVRVVSKLDPEEVIDHAKAFAVTRGRRKAPDIAEGGI